MRLASPALISYLEWQGLGYHHRVFGL